MPRELAAYLYSGVTAVRSAGDTTADVLKLRQRIASGERLGAELFIVGPLFTAEGGHGTEYAETLPEMMRAGIQCGVRAFAEVGGRSAEDGGRVEEARRRRDQDGARSGIPGSPDRIGWIRRF